VDYNLLDDAWIPVLFRNGETKRVGIRDALAKADQIRQIAASNPMDRLAILRFLLALLYWCHGNPPDGDGSLSRDSFPSESFSKLGVNRDCFNLLGDGKRFYQRRAKSGKDMKLSANYLVHEVPTGTNSWHFRHSTDYRNGLCVGCCAMGLLRLPLFATSGGRGKPPGVNQKPPVYVIPVGTSLAETLCLSWREVSASALGTPTWEETDLSLPERGNVPLLMGLTWLPRRVWLDDPEQPETNCISCGRKEPLIRQCVFAGIGSTKTDGNGESRVWTDPHTISGGEDLIKPSDALSATDAAADKWAEIAAGIFGSPKPNPGTKLWIVSFATVKNDKYLEAMEYEICFPSAPDERKFQENIDNIQKWKNEGRKLVRRAEPREAYRKHMDHPEIPPMIAAIRPQVEARVSEHAGKLLGEGDDAWQQAAGEYRPMMAAVAKSLSPGYTAAALRRRIEIASVKPDMRSKAAAKPGLKKGGHK
jgi:hypothetical protein